jgi:UDP-3-O-[3-hydroxymyristoyl] glucosamine N-acyltransferase
MVDDRFFRRGGPFTLGALAEHIGAEMPLNAPPEFKVYGLAALAGAGEGDVSVFSDMVHRDEFQGSHASVVVTSADLSKHALNGTWLLLTENPRLAFAQIGQLFYPPRTLHAAVHTSAVVDPAAEVGAGTEIAAGAVIGAGAKIGMRCFIGCNAVVAEGVMIGNDCVLGANTSVGHAMIGNGVHIASNTVIGGEGFGFVAGPKGLVRVPQLGRVIIEDGVEIGDNCAVDRGTMDDTIIGAGTAIDNLVQIGHNVRIGKCCVIAGQAGVAGSTTIGDFVMIGGQAAIKDHLQIGSHARIAGKAGVMRDVAPKESVAGLPAVPVRDWHRQTIALAKLSRRKPQ